MACCGRARQQATLTVRLEPRRRPESPPAGARAATVAFEYTGSTSLVAVGPVTGRRYVFNSRLARVVAIDARDRPGLRAVPHLRETQRST